MNISCKDGNNKGQKQYGPNRSIKILRRCRKNTQKNCTNKIFMTQITTAVSEGKSEGKWALGSIAMNKASGGDSIPAEPFQILKDDAVKVLHSICQQT